MHNADSTYTIAHIRLRQCQLAPFFPLKEWTMGREMGFCLASLYPLPVSSLPVSNVLVGDGWRRKGVMQQPVFAPSPTAHASIWGCLSLCISKQGGSGWEVEKEEEGNIHCLLHGLYRLTHSGRLRTAATNVLPPLHTHFAPLPW